MALYKKYVRSLHAHTGYRATWFPGVRMKLGDIGVIRAGIFDPQSTLKLRGIPYAEVADDAADNKFNFRSEGVLAVDVKAEGELNEKFKWVGDAKAGVRVEFSGADAVLLETKGARSHRIEDIAALDQELLRLVKLGPGGSGPEWHHDWVVITEVIDVDAATVLTSTDSGGEIELEAEGQLGPKPLVDAEAGLTVKSSRSVGIELVAERGLTPLYKARRIRKKWLWLWGLEVAPADGTQPQSIDDLFEDEPVELEGEDAAG